MVAELELEARSPLVEDGDIDAGCWVMPVGCSLRGQGMGHNGQAADWYCTG